MGSQVSVSAEPEKGEEDGVPYAIWSINITTSPRDAGKKWATCEFQQGDFPLSTDFKFLIFKKQKRGRIYIFGGSLEECDLNEQIEDDIKRQISEHYNIKRTRVIRCTRNKKIRFCIEKKQQPNKQSRQHHGLYQFLSQHSNQFQP